MEENVSGCFFSEHSVDSYAALSVLFNTIHNHITAEVES